MVLLVLMIGVHKHETCNLGRICECMQLHDRPAIRVADKYIGKRDAGSGEKSVELRDDVYNCARGGAGRRPHR